MESIKTLKKTLKKNAAYIRQLKSTRKSVPHGYVPELNSAIAEFRIGHIAYCLLRGKTKEQIEPRYKDPEAYRHKWIWKKAEQLKARLEEEVVDETLCPGA